MENTQEEKTTIEQEQTEQVEENLESKEDESLSSLVNQIKEQYETKLKEQEENFKKRIAERNKVIIQLTKGEPIEDDSNPIVDEINKRRISQAKKW